MRARAGPAAAAEILMKDDGHYDKNKVDDATIGAGEELIKTG